MRKMAGRAENPTAEKWLVHRVVAQGGSPAVPKAV